MKIPNKFVDHVTKVTCLPNLVPFILVICQPCVMKIPNKFVDHVTKVTCLPSLVPFALVISEIKRLKCEGIRSRTQSDTFAQVR